MNSVLLASLFTRSQDRCEARYPTLNPAYDYRCLNPADHVHHVLLRSHGARLLDDAADGTDPVRDLAHLMHVCSPCHGAIHGNPERSYTLRHLVRGSVTSGLDGRPVYRGDDALLADLWSEVTV